MFCFLIWMLVICLSLLCKKLIELYLFVCFSVHTLCLNKMFKN